MLGACFLPKSAIRSHAPWSIVIVGIFLLQGTMGKVENVQSKNRYQQQAWKRAGCPTAKWLGTSDTLVAGQHSSRPNLLLSLGDDLKDLSQYVGRILEHPHARPLLYVRRHQPRHAELPGPSYSRNNSPGITCDPVLRLESIFFLGTLLQGNLCRTRERTGKLEKTIHPM
jgi:hypothetical protein